MILRAIATGIFATALVMGFAVHESAASPGVQVVDCFEDPIGSGNWHYDFFVCSGAFAADGLRLELLPNEIGEGTVILGCGVPALPGYSCAFTATDATYGFPSIGSFQCVPGIQGVYLGIDIQTPDGFSAVYEIFTLNGDTVGAFTSSVSCPPVAVEPSSWGAIKSLYE